MKFKCPACGDIVERDMRQLMSRQEAIYRNGIIVAYTSYCDKKGRTARCKKVTR